MVARARNSCRRPFGVRLEILTSEEVAMKHYRVLVNVSLITYILLPTCADAAKARLQESKNHVRRISFPRKGNTATLKGTLQPYSNHIYRFWARCEQQVTIELRQTKELGRDGDLVFWIQSRGWYPAGRSSSVLEGIDKGGATNWSGILPGTGEYEIYVSNPPISDHPIVRSLPYRLRITRK